MNGDQGGKERGRDLPDQVKLLPMRLIFGIFVFAFPRDCQGLGTLSEVMRTKSSGGLVMTYRLAEGLSVTVLVESRNRHRPKQRMPYVLSANANNSLYSRPSCPHAQTSITPSHSFIILRLKPSFSANPSHRGGVA